jgi:hypothetical protein
MPICHRQVFGHIHFCASSLSAPEPIGIPRLHIRPFGDQYSITAIWDQVDELKTFGDFSCRSRSRDAISVLDLDKAIKVRNSQSCEADPRSN